MANAGNPYSHDKLAVASITLYCPNGCPYCISSSNAKESKGFSSDMEKLLDFLKELGDIGWRVEINGGEPSTVPGIVDFLNRLSERATVIVLSNGQRKEKFEESISSEIYLYYTWHSGRVSIDKFFHYSRRVRTEYKYLLHPEYISSGRYEQDMNEFSRFRVLHIAPFIGMWNGAYFNFASHIYKGKLNAYEYGKAVSANTLLECPMQKKKYLFINRNGDVYMNYDPSNKAGDISEPDWNKIYGAEPVAYNDIKAKPPEEPKVDGVTAVFKDWRNMR